LWFPNLRDEDWKKKWTREGELPNMKGDMGRWLFKSTFTAQSPCQESLYGLLLLALEPSLAVIGWATTFQHEKFDYLANGTLENHRNN